MCINNQYKIKDLTFYNKMIGNRIFVEIQSAIEKAGGRIQQNDLKNMSLQHLICICTMNQIQITFK